MSETTEPLSARWRRQPLAVVTACLALTMGMSTRGHAYVGSSEDANARIRAERPPNAGDAAVAAAVAATPRNLILKLRAGADACLSCALARRQGVGQLVPGSRLDALNHRFGVYAARPLLSMPRNKLVPEPRAAAITRQQQVAARFPIRTQRAPRGATFPDLSRTYVLEVRRRGDLELVAKSYAADPAVEYCEPDYVVQAAFTPNDPYFASRGAWGQDFDDLWGAKLIDAPTAWDTTHGAGVVVAVVDTGIDYTHPDIAANIWTNPGEIPNNGIDDDGNGYVDDVRGWDFASDDADPMDDHLHGTHVAGTIAAVGNNATGIIGVAFESKVMALRGLNELGQGTVSDLTRAILYAVDNGADVINASWGGTGRSTTLSDAIATAHAAGVVFVAAAGNSAADSSTFFPANDPNAIAVAASTHTDTRAYFSNFGVKIDVTAPGGGEGQLPPNNHLEANSVLSLFTSHSGLRVSSGLVVGTNYLRLAGTSMAAPHVSGTAALVLALHPEYSVEQVRQVLRSTADDIAPPGPDVDSGYGRVNAAHAVTAPAPLVAHIGTPLAGVAPGALSIAVTGSAAGPGFVSYSLDYGVGFSPTAWNPIAGPITTPVDDGPLGDWDISSLTDDDYVLRLTVTRPGGTFVDRVPVTLRDVAIDSPERLAALRTDAPIEIRGTAAGVGFSSYLVEYRRPGQDHNLWRTDHLTQTPNVAVRNGVLATLDVSDLTVGDRFDFRLTVVNGAGTQVKMRGGIIIDPTLRRGWPQQLVPVGDYDYLTVADLDGDNVKEILVGSGDEVVVFEPDGSVRPGWPQKIVAGRPFADTPASPIVADVTGDAAPEVIATNRLDLFVWSADGVLLPGFPRPLREFNGVNAWLTAADLDGDGKDEILCGSFGHVNVFFGDGREVPGWDSILPLPLLRLSDMPLAVGDVFGDGRMEVALYNNFFRGYGDGDMRAHALQLRGGDGALLPRWPRSVIGGFFTHVGMADFNGDGRLDLGLLREPDHHISRIVQFRALNARGGPMPVSLDRASSRLQRTGILGRSNGLPVYADVDRDGRAEAYLYGANFSSQVYGDNTGYFRTYRYGLPSRPPVPLAHPLLSVEGPRGMVVGDIDGDGQQELVAGVLDMYQCGGCVSDIRHGVVAQRLDGTIQPQFPKVLPQLVPEPGDPPGGFVVSIGASSDDARFDSPAIADLDGDGLKEVLWVDPDTNELFVWNVSGTPGPELADWPMYRHDPKHTNVLPPTK